MIIDKKIRTGDPEYARLINRRLILELFKKKDPISRFEMAKALSISKVTVSAIVGQLIDEGLVLEIGQGESMKKGGRKPILLSLNTSRYVIGVDIGFTNITVSLGNLKGEVVLSRKEPTIRVRSVEKVVSQIVNNIDRIIAEVEVNRDDVVGVGVSVAGIIDSSAGVVEESPDFAWQNVQIEGIIAAATGFEVIIDNCTRVMCRGELDYGCVSDVQNMFYVNIGHGVGSAMVVNGKIYNKSSEFGHVVVTQQEVLCDCGNYGCLEAVASGQAIEKRANSVISLAQKEWLTACELAKMADEGDLQAMEIFHEVGRYLGRAISMVANFFSPEKIVLGGGVSLSGHLFLEDIRQEFNAHTIKGIARNTSIRCSRLGEDSGIRGSVALALDKFLFCTE